jgi:hypothetical protein
MQCVYRMGVKVLEKNENRTVKNKIQIKLHDNNMTTRASGLVALMFGTVYSKI